MEMDSGCFVVTSNTSMGTMLHATVADMILKSLVQYKDLGYEKFLKMIDQRRFFSQNSSNTAKCHISRSATTYYPERCCHKLSHCRVHSTQSDPAHYSRQFINSFCGTVSCGILSC